MHYQTQILPIDNADGFLLAVCHGEHKIGGEDTRETGYAKFLRGRAGDPAASQELADLCLMPRPASAEQVQYELRMAKGQGELARSGRYPAATAAGYLANERQMTHAARLAGIDTVRVPRRVLASRAGSVLLGFEPTLRMTSGDELPGVLRLVNLLESRIAQEWRSARTPLDSPGKGAERYSSVQLGRPLALSLDAERLLLNDGVVGREPIVVACRTDAELTPLARLALPALAFIAIDAGWIALGFERVSWLGAGLEKQTELKLPSGSAYWGAAATRDGQLLALPGNAGGEIFVLARDGGKPRRFAPHRGVRRDAFARISLSDCGEWLASCCAGQVMLTRLTDGVSWPLGELQDTVREDASFDGVHVRSSLPASLGFVGRWLLGVQDSAIAAFALDEGAGAFVSEQGRAGARKPIRVKRGMPLDALLREARLARQIDRLQPFHSPAVLIRTKPLRKTGWLMPDKRGAPALGSSRFGGWPDLARGVDWPHWEKRPMAFLAQIDLVQAHAAQPGLLLPPAGLLSFFLGCTPDTYDKDDDPRQRYMMDLMAGTDAEGGGAWRVLYHSDTQDLERRVYPSSPLPELVEPCALGFTAGGLRLPDELCVAYEHVCAAMDASERDDYNELVGLLRPDDEEVADQLLGYPRLIQSTPPEMMCELSSQGRDPWQYPDAASPAYAAQVAAASRWGLLLQLTSNADADFCWGDGGHFYFYGPREAMARGDFSGVWVNFEN